MFRPCLLLALLAASCLPLAAATPPELTLLQQQYDKAVVAPHAEAVFDLNTKFVSALGNAITAAKQAGKLEEVLAMQEDQKRLTDRLPIPDDDEKTPEGLKKLRIIYRDQLAKLEAQRTANHTALLPAYTAKLKALEANLTKVDRIEDAKEVMTYREGLAAGAPTPQPMATANAPVATAPTIAPAATQAPKVKGDDRKAAEWLIKVGASFEIDDRSKRFKPAKLEELPKGKFVITHIGLDGRFTTEAITADGLANLRGLQALTSLLAGELTLTDSDVSFISTCPALENITFSQKMQITDAAVEHLVPLKSLKKLSVTGRDSFTGVTLHKLAVLRGLESLSVGDGTQFGAAGAEAISKLQSLISLGFEGTQSLTDEAIPHLSKLPRLTRLGVTNTNITPEGLASLKAKLDYLDCGKLSGKTPRDFAAIVGPAFPSVTYLRLPQSDDYTADDLAALVHFKGLTGVTILSIKDPAAWAGLAAIQTLEGITFDRNPFTDAEVDHLLKLPGLKTLSFGNVDVTDAGLLKLAALKKLKSIGLKPCPKVTEAGIAALKKKRPDIQISR